MWSMLSNVVNCASPLISALLPSRLAGPLISNNSNQRAPKTSIARTTIVAEPVASVRVSTGSASAGRGRVA